MNTTKRTGAMLLSLAALGLVSGTSSAGECETTRRAMNSSTTTTVTMSCKHNSKATTRGQVGVIGLITRAFLETAGAGSSGFARTTALDSSGNVINSCTAQTFIIGGDPVAKDCPSGARWFGTISFPE